MRNSTKLLFAGFVLATFTTGCGDFLNGPKLTDDPNKQQTTRTPDQWFIPIQANTWFLNEGQIARTAAVWHQQMAGVQRQFSSLDIYSVGEGDLETEWASFYTGGGIIDDRKLQSQLTALGDRRYLGIAKIYEAWLIGMAADLWGDVPYSEAVQDIATPKLDKQMDVYAAVETLLASALTDLSSGVGNGPGAADLVYAGNRQKWIDFAHTLRAKYYGTNGSGQFVGSKPGENNDATASDLSDTRLDPAFRQPLVTWRENQLIIAEAAYQTGDQVTALNALNAVRTDAGLTPVALSGAALLPEIMTQKWIEDFQKVETFQDYNRTCLPRLTPAPGATAIPGPYLYPSN